MLCAFGLCVLDLPVHLVHHLGEHNPDCQLLSLSVSLGSSLLDDGWRPSTEPAWEILTVPVFLALASYRRESPKARAPPAIALR
jgi:hypothetical protein